jgi:hypothetical protein
MPIKSRCVMVMVMVMSVDVRGPAGCCAHAALNWMSTTK